MGAAGATSDGGKSSITTLWRGDSTPSIPHRHEGMGNHSLRREHMCPPLPPRTTLRDVRRDVAPTGLERGVSTSNVRSSPCPPRLLHLHAHGRCTILGTHQLVARVYQGHDEQNCGLHLPLRAPQSASALGHVRWAMLDLGRDSIWERRSILPSSIVPFASRRVRPTCASLRNVCSTSTAPSLHSKCMANGSSTL